VAQANPALPSGREAAATFGLFRPGANFEELGFSDAPFPSRDEPGAVAVQVTSPGFPDAPLPAGPGLLTDLDPLLRDPPAAALDHVFAQGPEAANEDPGESLFSWVTGAMAVAACEIARRQVMRASRESGEAAAPAPEADWVPPLPLGEIP
jgi:hypothetical protein